MVGNFVRKSVVFVVLWTLATVAGLALVGIGFHFPGEFQVGSFRGEFNGGGMIFGFVLGGVSAGIVGVLQWLVLRTQFQKSAHWILAVMVGIGVMHAVADGIPHSVDTVVAILIGGVVISMLQAWVLKGQIKLPVTWIIVSMVGWIAAHFVAMTIVDATGLLDRAWTGEIGAAQHGWYGAIVGLIHGLISGTVLIRLKRVNE